jgi:hypothetical protein
MKQEITDNLFFIANRMGIIQMLNEEYIKVRKVMFSLCLTN